MCQPVAGNMLAAEKVAGKAQAAVKVASAREMCEGSFLFHLGLMLKLHTTAASNIILCCV